MRTFFSVLMMTGLAVAAEPLKPALTLNLWPAKAPGETVALPDETTVIGPKDATARVHNVSTPTLAIYLPPKEKANGAFVLIAPGGGYSILAINIEGTMVAEWLNSLGIAAGVLKYRVPKRKDVEPAYTPMLQDAQRAMSLVRNKAKEWNLDPKKIGMLGFSAGGNLTALTSTTEKRVYDAIDDVDKLASIPDFTILIYPAYLTEKDNVTLKPELVVTKSTPPMFFAHASNDPISSEGSIALYRALKKNDVPAEMHLYATGGHGFGLKPDHPIAQDWPKRCEGWMKARGILAK